MSDKLESLLHHLQSSIERLMEVIMALTPEVQALTDAITNMNTQSAAAVAAIGNLQTNITALNAQITSLQAAAAGGSLISAADLQAIKDATTALGTDAANLVGAVPAVTTPPAPAPAT